LNGEGNACEGEELIADFNGVGFVAVGSGEDLGLGDGVGVNFLEGAGDDVVGAVALGEPLLAIVEGGEGNVYFVRL
jgi:hypothetical protein